ncbi:similar to Saccharomyces cerevisiae YKR055W RHO4 Non-essential small GTPase of the Rho/Rac subfamily of Ras-like proteins, likely to be involved in the establishment of cell polarity [Maudiozyma barnettii]|uniref:Similar to Saccharomyces cerevisiae YKR055W RHO4 Non-essential small GTPase of the Rho/Rac subfamily of Ras-like proteins, likely to be involved in the establishment of cell polarity n=1 Tax=Maudiozyma barnettii TaxID=61262 RepID=A0A8H2ZGH5_9SACH|nr:Rho family GTPase RHO4 [Kazachstania barnettii]CAB4254604.1 similar to Saccharomyces cerevisiae YKR055W RHO4 Non-essential small GTPase of the Rho/Rac subfamily of Ras-like proteins, likely to be involved in the establishment of cell polarity [Kazachstania barnettii]CAD1782646.1 similar to Saccharomyces cerevisiae YKR055W RHO4 Non-essential small GTPase of the Rho/Rac subfamily of Ras-like proteins, likely to be involved in the establishment of cell polarity [Kazachstania barnettii]
MPSVSSLHKVVSLTSAGSDLHLHHAYSRQLSRVVSYAQMKEANAIPDDSFKLLIVGDTGIGKTQLWHAYVDHHKTNHDKEEDEEESHIIMIDDKVSGKYIQLALWDTVGGEVADRLRPLSYSNADIVILAYNVNDRISFENIRKKWAREAKHFASKSQKLLLGTQADYNNNNSANTRITEEEANEMAERIGAFSHLQCSVNDKINITKIMDVILDQLLQDGYNRDTLGVPLPTDMSKLLEQKLEKLTAQDHNEIDSKLHTNQTKSVPKKKRQGHSNIKKKIKQKDSCIIA